MRFIRQQGSTTWLALIMMFTLALLVLQQQHRQLQQGQMRHIDQRYYLQAYQQAASALSWGLSQPWPLLDLGAGWWCQQLSSETLQTCARLGSKSGQWILRGKGQGAVTQPVLWLYQITYPLGFGNSSVEKPVYLQSVDGGWLDFCPEREVRYCVD